MRAVAEAVVIVAGEEVDDRHELDEDIQRYVVEVERDAERNADAERGAAVIADPLKAIVEVPEPEAATDVDGSSNADADTSEIGCQR